MTPATAPPTHLSNTSWSSTPFSSKKALYPFCCDVRPLLRRDLPPDVERTKENVRAYAGGEVGLEGVDVDDIVIRSVTICDIDI